MGIHLYGLYCSHPGCFFHSSPWSIPPSPRDRFRTLQSLTHPRKSIALTCPSGDIFPCRWRLWFLRGDGLCGTLAHTPTRRPLLSRRAESGLLGRIPARFSSPCGRAWRRSTLAVTKSPLGPEGGVDRKSIADGVCDKFSEQRCLHSAIFPRQDTCSKRSCTNNTSVLSGLISGWHEPF